jgi:hypothetical protein
MVATKEALLTKSLAPNSDDADRSNGEASTEQAEGQDLVRSAKLRNYWRGYL